MNASDQNTSSRRRALNMVWTAAGEYGFDPGFLAFLQDGQPDHYMNSIIGYVHKWYDRSTTQELFDLLGGALIRETYDGLLWIGLENCAYEREVKERPVLAEMRTACAEEFFAQQHTRSRQQWMAQNSLVYALQEARWRTVLGREPGLMNPWERRLFHELEYDGSMNASDILERTVDIFSRYFHFRPDRAQASLLLRLRNAIVRLSSRALPRRVVREEQLTFGRPDLIPGGMITQRKSQNIGPESLARERSDRLYIESCFGPPLYAPEESRQTEEALCSDCHLGCHLHFTAGQRNETVSEDPLIRKTIRDAQAQGDRNRAHYQEKQHLYQNSITRLAQQIENALLVYPQPLKVRSRMGRISPGDIWRAVRLEDERVFMDTFEEEQPDFSVDLMLDASASRMQSQEIIAAQGYVIARSLRLNHVPVQVHSFLSLRGFTVLNLFCGYDDPANDSRIFDYFAAGWNRDGLALKGAEKLMSSSPAKNRLLIVLTDASPNDDRRLPANREKGRLISRDYSGEAGIEDTAAEVRRLRKNGIRVMAVLSGEDGDTEAARKIYGSDFVRIENISRLSDAVGALLQKHIERMQITS